MDLDTKRYSAGDAKYGSKYTEADFTLSYSKKFGMLQKTPGWFYYSLGALHACGTVPQYSQEVFLSLGLDTILSPKLTVYKEIDHCHQLYFLLGRSNTFDPVKKSARN